MISPLSAGPRLPRLASRRLRGDRKRDLATAPFASPLRCGFAASPPGEKTTARQDQTGQASTDDGAGDKLTSDFTTRKIGGVNVEISEMVL
jgi:hypothetical protein